jgi:hypothetical protein
MPVIAAAGILLVLSGMAGASVAAGTGVATTAAAASLSNHQIAGTEVAISCISPTRCVAVGSGAHDGQVVSLYNGKQALVTTVQKSPLTSVSCPSGRAGCWAVGPLGGPKRTMVGVELVRIGATGKVTNVIKVTEPTGYVLNRIICASMTSCNVIGQNPNAPDGEIVFYMSAWNGKTLRMHAVGELYNGSSLDGLSCWRANCVAVGWQQLGSASGTAYAWTFTNGKPGAFLTRGLKTTFNAVSCVSLSTCWVIGYSHGSGVVVTDKDGVLSKNEALPDAMAGLECQYATCRAVGGDVILTIKNGLSSGSPVIDTATTGFSAITSRGTGFVALGGTHKPGVTEVVTG